MPRTRKVNYETMAIPKNLSGYGDAEHYHLAADNLHHPDDCTGKLVNE